MVKKWSIYWVDHNPVIGSEQSGVRPALVISNDMVNEIMPVITILPVSSLKKISKIYPTEILLKKEISGLPLHSVAMAHQIRTISKQRIGNKCGEIVDLKARTEIEDVIRDYFEL